MLSTHYFGDLSFDWQLSLMKLLRLILLAHWTTNLPFSLAQEQKLLFLGNWTFVFSFPVLMQKLLVQYAFKWNTGWTILERYFLRQQLNLFKLSIN